MSFREKTAWIALISYVAVYGYYFWRIYGAIASGETETFHYGWLLTDSVIALVVIQIVLIILVAIFKPRDAKQPRDELDKLIWLKATRVACAVVMAGAFSVAVAIALGAPAFYTANALFLVTVAAEVARSTGQIVQYRRHA
jgi:hypothetical protein